MVRTIAFLPWGSADGCVPELLIPSLPVSTINDPNARWRANVVVRALPDGTPLLRAPDDLWARFVDRVRVIRLSTPIMSIDVTAPDGGQVQDVTMDSEGNVFVLDNSGGLRRRLRRLRPDGSLAWTREVPSEYDARFITDDQWRVFLPCMGGREYSTAASEGFLVRVDNESCRVVASREGWYPHMRHDGRIYFTRLDETDEQWLWTRVDEETGVTSTFDATFSHTMKIHKHIGDDSDGNWYGTGRFDNALVRVSPADEIDWHLENRGIAASREHGAAVLIHDRGSGTVVIHHENGHLDMAEHGKTFLIGRRDDDGYVLQRSIDDGIEILDLDSRGTVVATRQDVDRSEFHRSELHLASDDNCSQTTSSVRPDGEILSTVLNSAGVHVIGVKITTRLAK
nr:hypothetical protein [Kibdelosporangium sp. MJ126-NF4]